MKMEKTGKKFKLNTRELRKNEKQGLKHVHESLTRKRLNGRSYKEFLIAQARKAKVSDLMLGSRENLSQGGSYVTENYRSSEVNAMVVDSCRSCSKRQRVDCNLKQEACFCNTELNNDKCGVSLPVETFGNASMSMPQKDVLLDGRELEAGLSLELAKECIHEIQCKESQLDIEIESQHTKCVICMPGTGGGKILCCDGKQCRRSFHLSCVNPPLADVPPGVWHCIWCVEKKIQFGVHSVSEGVESILDAREVVSDDEVMQRQKQYLVKYKGLAHVHNVWIPERELLLEAPMLFAKFKKPYKTIKWKTEWSVPHRLLHKRLLIFPKHHDNHFQEHDGNDSDCHYEWLVKWTGLTYDHATWELENASFLRTPGAMKLIEDFESRHQKSKRLSHPSKEDEGRKITFHELSEFPFGGSPGVHNCHLTHVNKLREYWHTGQNAVVFGDQERVVKVVLFILSLQDDVKQPFLIITASTTLSLWEAEFSRWASSTNIVVYKGNRDVRAIIRTWEFYDERGCIKFQVLLSPPNVVVEDLQMIEHIKWEAIIIDECQRPRISEHLKQIKMLAADMRLLLASCQVMDRRFNYRGVLSLLDSEFDGIEEDALEIDPNVDICQLKERLAQFVAFECKSDSSKFAEYWVPVRLSNVQIELYCASLLSHSILLCSCLKNDSTGSLRDILILTRKCCDHPYLVDQSLLNSITRDLPVVDDLDIGINVSGKLQLLDRILSEIKNCRLRVLILFQSLGGSGLISSIGDILDDFVHQRFGEDSYARIDGEMVRSKKQAALNMFNNKESGRFVCLMENRACLPSIKLSSVDLVILFDSDWNPLNDLRSLQKITIDSQFEQLKVFRFYSSCTVEEKVLILAKQGMTLDSNIQNINWSMCHMLLTWGASYLFNKLDDFHVCKAPVSHSSISSEQSLLDDLFCELSALLPCNREDGDPTVSSKILKVQLSEGAYPGNISLLGEGEVQSTDSLSVIQKLLDNEPPHVFWTNLLEGRDPRWKYLSTPLQRVRRKVRLFDDWFKESIFEGDVKKKCCKVVNNTDNLMSLKTRLRKKRKVHAGIKESKLEGASQPSAGNKSKEATDNMHNPNRVSESLSMPHVAKDVSMECEGRDMVTLGEHVTEVKQHSETATLVGGEIPTKASSPTLQLHTRPAQGSALPSHQLPISTNAPYAEHVQVDVPGSWGTHNLRSNGRHASGRQAQVPRERPMEDSTGLSNSSVLLTITNLPLQPSTHMSVGGSESDASNLGRVEPGNNHPLQASLVTSEMLQSACLDPLQMEMERIQKDIEQAIRIHEDMKVRVISECDKEIAAIRKKYDALLQEVEMMLVKQRKDLDTYYNKVYVNKLLAEALTQKYNSTKAAGSQGMQQVTLSSFLNEIAQLYSQQTAPTANLSLEQQSSASLLMTSPPATPPALVVNHSSEVQPTAVRSTLRIEQYSANLPSAGPPSVTPTVQMVTHSTAVQQSAERTTPRIASLPMTAPPAQVVIHSSAVQQTAAGNTPRLEQSSSSLPRTGAPMTLPVQLVSRSSDLFTSQLGPCSTPMIHGAGKPFVGSEIRATAPHLRHGRPSSYVSAPNLPNFANPMPMFPLPLNPHVASSMLTQPTHRLPTYQSGSISGICQPESGGVLPSIYGSISTPEPPMGINNLLAAEVQNQFFSLQDLGSNYRAI